MKKKRIFISWCPFSSRSQILSEVFGAKPYYISYCRKKTIFYTILRYFLAVFHTLYIIFHERPQFVFMMNQPVFLPMIVFMCSKIGRFNYIIDSHSGLFNKSTWRRFIPIMRIIYGSSFLNMAHNDHDAKIYKSWGVKTIVLGTEFYGENDCKMVRLRTRKNVVLISVFASDEPICEVLKAASDLPDFNFYITGAIENARKLGIFSWPKNVTLTDFLPRNEFVGLVKAADAAMVLVTTDNTMQRGAFEAVSWGIPLIISDWPVLRKTFPRGVVFVRNSSMSIRDGVMKFFDNKELLKRQILELRREKIALWNAEVGQVKLILDAADK